VADLDRPVEAFTTLNEFFARPLRAGARPIADPDNSDVVISPADCRLLCFESIHGEGTIAVKGRQPSVSSLLGLAAGPNVLSGIGVNAARAFHDDLAEGNGFSVAVARLAPSDYHRYHWPTDATWQPDGLVEIMGSYQSVAPTAIASSVDVLGTNRRSVIVATSAAVGTFAVVVIGAVKVGSIQLTATPGAVHKGDELGLFRYGGSTVAIIFDAGRVTFDPDLLANSTRDLETTVSMGEQIGRSAP
jgi:phosphatidylserine decarboxylase